MNLFGKPMRRVVVELVFKGSVGKINETEVVCGGCVCSEVRGVERKNDIRKTLPLFRRDKIRIIFKSNLS